MASKVIGFRVPEDIAEELEKVSDERGMRVADFLRSLVDEALYPDTQLHNNESDSTAREQVESLSSAYRDLTNRVQGLSTMVDRAASKIAGYELEGILGPKIAEKIQEIEKNKSNIVSLKNEVDTININLEVAEKNIGNFSRFVLSSESLFAHLQKEIKGLRSQFESTVSSSTGIKQLESKVNQMTTDIAALERKMTRLPTGEVHTLKIEGRGEHTYRVFSRTTGLVKPYMAYTTLSGRRYVDLSEPLD